MSAPGGPGGGDREGFLARWSARKRAESALPSPAPPPLPGSVSAPGPGPGSEPAPEPPPEDAADPELLAALPRIEDIGPGTDIRGFLQRGVPRALRNAALRRAWVTNPAIATHEDPARDYFWDWNAPGGVPGGGGRLTAAEALRMAERVLGSPPPRGPAAGPEGAEGAEGAAADDPAVAAPAQPDTAAAPDATPDTAAEAPARAQPAEPPARPPGRRHGGAMPA
jgi:hypothetical protein